MIRKSPRQPKEPEVEAVTLGRLLKQEHTAVEMASLCMEGYIERNTENAIQRAIGIEVFITGVTKWGYSSHPPGSSNGSRCDSGICKISEQVGKYIH